MKPIRRMLAGIAAALALAAPAVQGQTYTMRLSTSTSNDAVVEWLTTFKNGVEARSNGRLKAQVYPASQLGATPRTTEGVALGTIEVAMNAAGFYEGLEPRFAVLSAPGLFDGLEHANKVLTDPEVQKRLGTFGAGKGVAVLTVMSPSPFSMVSHKPVRTLADLKGQKIRVPGSPVMIEQFKQFGSSPVSMPLGEVLPAMQNKVIDGMVAGPNLLAALKYYDVAKSMTTFPSSWASGVAIINRNFLKTVGPELERIIFEEARKADAAIVRWSAQDLENARRIWKSNGGTEIEFNAADAARFNELSLAAATPLLTQTPDMAADLKAFRDVAQKYRKEK